MPFKFEIAGLDDLKKALRALPAELADDAAGLVRSHALNAAGAIRAGYARRTGNLQAGVYATDLGVGTKFGARWIVRSRAPHAYIYEYGTQARHYFTPKGAKHATGIMPAAPAGRAFIPRMIEARRRLYAELEWVLVRNGLAAKRAA